MPKKLKSETHKDVVCPICKCPQTSYGGHRYETHKLECKYANKEASPHAILEWLEGK